jgi:anti-sigma factor RsiW
MTCRKVRKLIPLATGDDLRPRPKRAAERHIDACPGCRREYEAFRAALAEIKAAAKAQDDSGWSEAEWSTVMARVAAAAEGAGKVSRGVARPAFSPRLAAASALGAILSLVVLGLLFRGPTPQPGRAPSDSALVIASDKTRQDKVSITLVSPETGLQVVWFLDRNFDYQGEQE